MSGILAAPFFAAALLLPVAAIPKLVDPMPLVKALRSVGIPVSGAIGRLFALSQIVIFLAVLAFPGRASALALCCIYAGFSAFVWTALHRGGVVASCGCFGKADTPPTRSHLAGTVLLAGVAGLGAIRPAWVAVTAEPGALMAIGAGTALIAFLAWQLFSILPPTTPAAIHSIRTAPGLAASTSTARRT